MANKEINDLTAKTTPVSTDEVEIQETGGGLSKKTTIANLSKGVTVTASQVSDFDTEVANNSAVSANTAKVSYTDAAKVAEIEASADVTDATNVTAAGALMDSEVTNLAQVKAFDTSDYATATQGTKADNAATASSVSNVDNTTDAGKPVSTAQQTALNLKANLVSPTFTGTVSGITSTMVGLGNVDNTSNATERAAAATLSNKTIASPTIAQINNSSAPGVKLQRRTQTDDSNSIANATTAGVITQMGWGQVQGSGSINTTDTVTFPTAFTTVLGVQISILGYKTPSAATSITAMTGNFGAIYSAAAHDISTTQFTAEIIRGSSTMSASVYFGYSWIAWGV